MIGWGDQCATLGALVRYASAPRDVRPRQKPDSLNKSWSVTHPELRSICAGRRRVSPKTQPFFDARFECREPRRFIGIGFIWQSQFQSIESRRGNPTLIGTRSDGFDGSRRSTFALLVGSVMRDLLVARFLGPFMSDVTRILSQIEQGEPQTSQRDQLAQLLHQTRTVHSCPPWPRWPGQSCATIRGRPKRGAPGWTCI
jgi:hypothetical protein